MSQTHFTDVLTCVSLLFPEERLAGTINIILNFFNLKKLIGSRVFLDFKPRVNSYVSLL